MKRITQDPSLTRWLKNSFVAACGFVAATTAVFADANCVLPTPGQQPFNPAIRVQLPDGTNGIEVNATGNPASLTKMTLKNVPAGFSVTNGTYRSWCVDPTGPLCPRDFAPCVNSIYKPILFNSCDTASLIGAGLPSTNWNQVNFIINNRPLWTTLGYNVSEIQAAIWRFVGYNAAEEADLLSGNYGFGLPAGLTANVDDIVGEANTFGATFVPGVGQVLAVVMQFRADLQDEVADADKFKAGQLSFIEVICAPPGSIGDTVFCDLNENGIQDSGETGIPNVQVNLVCTTAAGTVTRTATTNSNGNYLFSGLAAGTCTVSVNTATLPADCNKVLTVCPVSRTVTLAAGQNRLDVDFCFGRSVTGLVRGDTATIGYWANKNGQALIKAANGSASSTALANWLATNFPYCYGANAGVNNLTGKTNTDVAALFIKFKKVTGAKTDAQVMGGALAVYLTNSGLAGNVATAAGFNVSATGTGAKSYNVGSYGSAIGLSNNTSYTILKLLQQANLQKQLGTFNANAFNAIFSGINEMGDRY